MTNQLKTLVDEYIFRNKNEKMKEIVVREINSLFVLFFTDERLKFVPHLLGIV